MARDTCSPAYRPRDTSSGSLVGTTLFRSSIEPKGHLATLPWFGESARWRLGRLSLEERELACCVDAVGRD